LREIGAALTRIAKTINTEMPQFKTQEVRQKYTTHVTKLDVLAFDQPVRIEPNATLRGAVLAIEERPLVKRCQTEFSLSVDASTLAIFTTFVCFLPPKGSRILFGAHL